MLVGLLLFWGLGDQATKGKGAFPFGKLLISDKGSYGSVTQGEEAGGWGGLSEDLRVGARPVREPHPGKSDQNTQPFPPAEAATAKNLQKFRISG